MSIKLEFSQQSFEKYSNIKLHKNLASRSRVVPRGQTDRQTDMTKLIVAFRNFAKTPKKYSNGGETLCKGVILYSVLGLTSIYY
jgi:hypothetical protein